MVGKMDCYQSGNKKARRRSLTASALLVSLLTIVGCLGLVVFSTVLAQQGKKQLTVERIYSKPSLSGQLPRGLQWSPNGEMITYLQPNKAGQMDIWYYEVKTGKRALLVDSKKLLLEEEKIPPEEEEGKSQFQIRRYIWSPTSSHLLFPLQGDLFLYHLSTGTLKRLTATKEMEEEPKFSPDGRYVSFVRNYNLFAIDLKTGQEFALTTDGYKDVMNGKLDWVYPEELEITTAYWWSPDSRYVAYLQMDERPVPEYPIVDFIPYHAVIEPERYPKAGDPNPIVRVGVVALKNPQTIWMDVGKDTDIYIPRVMWLPDGKTLAIQRLNRAQNQLDLLFADATTGKSRCVLRETDSHWINLHDHLYFLKNGERFLWSSERDGFRHFYLYNIDGKLLRQLTSGNWQVVSLCGIDEKKGIVYFTATEKDVLERHLYRIKLNGSGFKRLTSRDGTHHIVMAPDCRHYLDYYSTVVTPIQLSLHRANGKRVAFIAENQVAELQEYVLSTPEFLIITTEDGATLHAMMIKPADFDSTKKYPVIVHIYGGPHAQVVRNAWGGSGYLWHQMMVQKGYIIFSLDNRGSYGRGKAWETTIYHRFGEVELKDQLCGVEYLKSLPYVDSQRIGIWGWSYGGYMTCYAMLNAPEVFKVGVAVAPVTDWRDYDTIYTERYMGLPKDNPEGYEVSSPVNQVANLKGKLLICHGTSDDNVHFQNAVQLADKLIKVCKQFDLMLYPGKKHGIRGQNARIHLFTKITNCFLENL